MTWSEIKKAVEQAGTGENEEIGLIQCENGGGDHTFHKMRLGKALKLAENVSAEKAREDLKAVRFSGVAYRMECIAIGSMTKGVR